MRAQTYPSQRGNGKRELSLTQAQTRAVFNSEGELGKRRGTLGPPIQLPNAHFSVICETVGKKEEIPKPTCIFVSTN